MTQVIDLDLDGFDDPDEEAQKKLPSKTVRLSKGSPPWRVLTGLHSYNLSALTSGDPEAIASFIDNSIHPLDRAEFRKWLSSRVGMTPEHLGKLINTLIEVASERPLNRPSALRPGASKRTSTRKSAASS